jgi:hypothetical protein
MTFGWFKSKRARVQEALLIQDREHLEPKARRYTFRRALAIARSVAPSFQKDLMTNRRNLPSINPVYQRQELFNQLLDHVSV